MTEGIPAGGEILTADRGICLDHLNRSRQVGGGRESCQQHQVPQGLGVQAVQRRHRRARERRGQEPDRSRPRLYLPPGPRWPLRLLHAESQHLRRPARVDLQARAGADHRSGAGRRTGPHDHRCLDAKTHAVKPELDKESMAAIFLRYKGAEAGEIDWGPPKRCRKITTLSERVGRRGRILRYFFRSSVSRAAERLTGGAEGRDSPDFSSAGSFAAVAAAVPSCFQSFTAQCE